MRALAAVDSLGAAALGDDFSYADEWGPEKVVLVSDARSGMRGALVIDNTARGQGKGGTRMAPDLSISQVARLARVMTWKWAAVDIGFGGAKAGIRFDPASPLKEHALRRFVRALSNEVPAEYVFGLDMGLDERDAAVVLDELRDRGAAVGTPQELGGVPYDQWGVTGHGVAEAAAAAVQWRGGSLHGARVVIQGFGAVGVAAARRLSHYGALIVAVSTSCGGLHDPSGLDVESLIAARADVGDDFVRHVDGCRYLPPGQELELEADILVPAARQDVIDAELARRLKMGLVVEGANLPASADALQILQERGVTVVPDFIANAGGVVAAAFAMDARYSAFPVERAVVLQTIASKLRTNTTDVLTEAARAELSPHAAALGIAKARVRAAMDAAGAPRLTRIAL